MIIVTDNWVKIGSLTATFRLQICLPALFWLWKKTTRQVEKWGSSLFFVNTHKTIIWNHNLKASLSIPFTDQVSTLFRASSFATTLMDQYMKMTCTEFVQAAVRAPVCKICDSKQSCEVNLIMIYYCIQTLTRHSWTHNTNGWIVK